MRLYLRFGGHLAALRDGENVLGRSSSCDVVVPDDVASRRHAEIQNENGRLTIRDLGSRNGLILNDVPVVGTQTLRVGDRITIGGTELLVTEKSTRQSTEALETARDAARDSATQTDAKDVYGVLVTACRDALDGGDMGDAAFAANNLMLSARSGVERGMPPNASVFQLACDFALLLVERTGEQDWMDRLFELYRAQRMIFDRTQVDRILASVVRPSPGHIDGYLDEVRAATAQESACLDRLRDLLRAGQTPGTQE